ncbi:MAG TPA: ferredoxin [Microthrixaceae bacterium]|nr:ferredoxin [Microthrixaceae bacterium]
MTVRIRTHPGLCTGYGNCHRWAPDLYPLDDEGEIAVHLLEVPDDRALDAWRGAAACPQGAITVIGYSEADWRERDASVELRPATGRR